MKRRKFLITSGAVILGSTATQSLNQNPAVALNFDLVGIENSQPSNTDTILVDFKNFELVPKYIDETAGDATVTIKLDIEDHNNVETQTDVTLTNGEPTTGSDIGSAIPIIQDNINSNKTALDGSIEIDISHPDISDSYKQKFVISDDPLQNGLIRWWPLHEWSGKANDLSKSQANATVSGAEQGVWGKSSLTSYSFNGSSDYVNIDGVPQLDSLTVSFWFRSGNTEDAERLVNLRDNNSIQISHRKDMDNKIGVYIKETSSESIGLESSTKPVQEWAFVSLTWNGSKAKLYVNGDLEDSKPMNSVYNRGIGDSIGVADGKSGLEYDGLFSDLRIYDRSLSDSEINDLYSLGVGSYTDGSLHNGSDPAAISRWRFNGNTNDSWGSNNGNDNTSTSSGYTVGVQGKSKQFNRSSDDFVDVGSPISVSDGDSITISCWARFNDINNERYGLVTGKGTGFDIGLRTITTGEAQFYHRDKNSNVPKATSKPLQNNTWYHLVGAWDDSSDKLKIYLNGVLYDTKTADGVANDPVDSWDIGKQIDREDRYLSGEIDDVRIYDRDLNLSEVQELYQWGTRGQDLRKRTTTKNKNNLVGWWKLNETNGNTAYDSSGSGNNGIINGATQNSTTDPVGNPAYEFDGDEDYIEVSNTGASSPVSVTAWIYPRTAGESDYGRIFDQYNDFDLALGDGSSNTILWEINNNNYWFGSNTLDKNNWYHLAATVDSSGVGKVYIDGVLLEEKQLETVSSSNNKGYIGSMQSTKGYLRWFDGYISDVRIYDREITPQEVSYLYEQKF